MLGKAERLAEAEAGAFADFLGGEERLEDARDRRLVHPGAGIGDGKLCARVHRLERDAQRALARHRLDRVGAEVHQHLVELRRVAHHVHRCSWHIALEQDSGRERPAHQVEGLGDHATQVHPSTLAALAAAVGRS